MCHNGEVFLIFQWNRECKVLKYLRIQGELRFHFLPPFWMQFPVMVEVCTTNISPHHVHLFSSEHTKVHQNWRYCWFYLWLAHNEAEPSSSTAPTTQLQPSSIPSHSGYNYIINNTTRDIEQLEARVKILEQHKTAQSQQISQHSEQVDQNITKIKTTIEQQSKQITQNTSKITIITQQASQLSQNIDKTANLHELQIASLFRLRKGIPIPNSFTFLFSHF